jgi:hypothetical protein
MWKEMFPQAIELQLEIVLQEHYESYGYDSLILSNPDTSDIFSMTLAREVKDETENIIRKIFGFQINFDIDTKSLTTRQFQDTISYLEQIIQNLTDNLHEYDWIKHLVKFHDDVLLELHLTKMREVHEIEMKLRQVISLIYLSAFNDEQFYKLLRFDKIKTQPSLPNNENEMKEICENEFYHLTFKQYSGLNKKKDLGTHKELIEFVIEANNFDELKGKLLNNPIKNENDIDMLSALNDTAPRIEDFRNCVAHNRKLSEDLLRNYSEAKGLLLERLDNYLEEFSISDS